MEKASALAELMGVPDGQVKVSCSWLERFKDRHGIAFKKVCGEEKSVDLTDDCLFVCFCCFTSHVNSYGHCGTVSLLNHTFSWAGLSKRLTSNLCTYFGL